MKSIRTLVFVALAAVPLASQAQTSLGVAGRFNAFVFGSASVQGGESQGPVAVGGSFTLNGAFNTDIQKITGPTIGAKTNVSLYVGGNVVASNGGQLNFGNGYVGGNFVSPSSKFNLNNGSTLRVGGSIVGAPQGGVQGGAFSDNLGAGLVDATVFTAQKALSKSQSESILGLGTAYANSFSLNPTGDQNNQYYKVTNHSGTVVSYADRNNLNIDVTQFTKATMSNGANIADKNVYVFNIAESLIDGSINNGSLNLNWNGLTSTSTLLVNVIDTNNDGVVNWGVKNSDANIGRILYNFGAATSLSIGGNSGFNGSILAYKATVNQTQVIQGNLIANAWNTQNSPEIHLGIGDGDTRFAFGGYAPQAVPEPGAWAALGLGAMAVLRRRRK